MLTFSSNQVSEEMSIFDGARSSGPAPLSHVAGSDFLCDIIEEIQDGTHSEGVQRVRSADKGSEAHKEAKLALGSFTVSGLFTKARNGFPQTHTGLVQIDLDGKDNPGLNPEEMRERVKALPSLIAFFVSPSGDGLKLILKVGVASDNRDHRHRFECAKAAVEKLGLKVDASGKDPARLCFYSHDPDAFYRSPEEAEEIQLIELASEAPQKEWKGEGIHHPLPVAKRALDAIKEKLEGGKPDYDLWLALTAGMSNSYGSDGLALMKEIFPEKKLGEYENKRDSLPKAHNAGFIFNQAKELAGWEASTEEKADFMERMKKDPMETARGVALPADGGPQFNPSAIYYLSKGSIYLVDVGGHYREYSKVKATRTGITGFFRGLGLVETEAKELASSALDVIETKQAVDWSGSIAGKQVGVMKMGKRDGLILESYDLPEAKAGKFPTIQSIVNQAFPDAEEREFVLSWISGRVKAVRAGVHQPSPLLVMAGEINAGKSLMGFIIKLSLGGRVANPMVPWSGSMTWNDDLLASELLLIDDSNARPGHKERQNLKANFKEFIYGGDVSIMKRNTSTMTARPVSAVVICCNKTPEELKAVPPIEEDSADKIALTIVSKVTTPIPTDTPEGRKKLQKMLRAELPAFLHHLEHWEIPKKLGDSRTGVKAWKNAELLKIIEGNKPETVLEELLQVTGKHGWVADEWYSASELASRLKAPSSPVLVEARNLLQYHTNAGTYLTALHKRGSSIVKDKRVRNGTTQYLLDSQSLDESDCF